MCFPEFGVRLRDPGAQVVDLVLITRPEGRPATQACAAGRCMALGWGGMPPV